MAYGGDYTNAGPVHARPHTPCWLSDLTLCLRYLLLNTALRVRSGSAYHGNDAHRTTSPVVPFSHTAATVVCKGTIAAHLTGENKSPECPACFPVPALSLPLPAVWCCESVLNHFKLCFLIYKMVPVRIK